MNEYWKKRNSELLKIHAQKADDIERELIKEYERSLNGIKKEIEMNRPPKVRPKI